MSAKLQTYGPYTALRLLASGNQGQVWLAKGSEGQVALKVARTPEQVASLKMESDLLMAYPHPGLVRVLGRAKDASWVAMERVQGTGLERWSREQSLLEVVQLMVRLIDVLIHLHEHDMVHADLTPSKVLVDRTGQPRLLDLGLANVPPGPQRRRFRGTLGYAAPELLRGEEPTQRTDVYGVGALLYALVTGRTPFAAADPAALAYLPMVSLPVPPSSLQPDLPSAFSHLLLVLLSREAGRRPSDLDRVRAALTRAAQGSPEEPVLGMDNAREVLRQAVVGAADGEGRVVVVYGPPGSGRRTLISEALASARREGMPHVRADAPLQVLPRMSSYRRPAAVIISEHSPEIRRFLTSLIQLHIPALVLVHARHPLPGLDEPGISQITPEPLTVDEVRSMLSAHGAEVEHAAAVWRSSRGLPGRVLGYIRGPVTHDLAEDTKRVLLALTDMPVAVEGLAQRLGIAAHLLLDHAELLVARGLVEPTSKGAALRRLPR